jgi:ubiquinone biosynthesis monooxygenase Coq6
MAFMTENTNLQSALLRRIEEVGKGRVEIREMERGRVGEMILGEGERWVGLKVGEEWVKGSVVVSSLVYHWLFYIFMSQVGADGPNSPVRKFAQIDTYGHSYPTHAVVATMHHLANPLSPNDTAYQRFLPTGPLAFLPLSETASTLVWSTSPALAAAYKKLGSDALVVMVNAGYTLPESALAEINAIILSSPTPPSAADLKSLVAPYLPQIPMDTPLSTTITAIPSASIASFPLRLSHADVYHSPSTPRVVLIGDAAHTIHPLAGQGLNMGLADVRALSDVWEETKQRGGDLGSYTSLLGYSRARYAANHVLLSMTDKLHHIFGARGGVVDWVRGWGLEVINELGPIKKALMQNAGAKVGEGGGWG